MKTGKRGTDSPSTVFYQAFYQLDLEIFHIVLFHNCLSNLIVRVYNPVTSLLGNFVF